MNAKRGIIVLGLLSAASMPTWAQQIKGVVIDQKSKETLIGAVITVDGTNVKAITNIDGNFLIDGMKKDKTYTLYINYVGYKTQKIDGVERQDGPTALILSRQNLAQQERTEEQLANIARGGYVLKDCAGQPELIFIATGSEVELAVAAYEKLTAEGVKARVVSMPSTDAFDKQDAAYRESVLPKAVTARVAVEAGIADYWYKYVGLNGAIVGMTTFGESAPAELLFEEFGFTVDNVVAKAKELL